jgi:hypothetical protein
MLRRTLLTTLLAQLIARRFRSGIGERPERISHRHKQARMPIR